MDESLGAWEPLDLADVVELFHDAPFRWWVTGGHALEMHFQRSWRTHDDIDVSFLRNDAPKVRDQLVGWDIHAADGALTPWSGDPPIANNLWARPSPHRPWAVDMTIADGDEEHWVYRRDPSLRRTWDEAVLRSAVDGTPYLAPELQMLFKSTNVRPKDQVDAGEVLPNLDAKRSALLRRWLPTDHEWAGTCFQRWK